MSDNIPFDPEQYLDGVQQAAPATIFTPVPEGDYPAHVKPGSVKVNVVKFDPSKNGVNIQMADGSTVFGGKELEVYWLIDDASVAETLGMKEPSVRQRFWLDLTETGEIAGGVNKNVRLGKLLSLAGADVSRGWSFRQIEQATGRIRVKHTPDRRNPDVIYAEVAAVTAA